MHDYSIDEKKNQKLSKINHESPHPTLHVNPRLIPDIFINISSKQILCNNVKISKMKEAILKSC